jgi:hypothetical protein
MIMTPGLRKFALTAHVTSSAGWLGAVTAFLALAVAGLTSQDAQLVRAAYLAMELTGWFVIVPFGIATLVTGLVQAVGTPWGLFRHYHPRIESTIPWSDLGSVGPLLPTAFVIQPKELDDRGDVLGPAKSDADPPALGQHMMHRGPAGPDELFPHLDWEREIRKPIPVKMAQLPAADTEFDSAESVGHHHHTWPTRHRLLDQLAEGFSHHTQYDAASICQVARRFKRGARRRTTQR